MKKLLVMFMMGTLCLGMMTGCGKSEEEKAQEEFEELMRKEAEEDIAAYEAKRAANEEARAQQAASLEELQGKYFGKLDDLLAQYEASTKASDIQKIARKYNALYAQMKAEADAADISTSPYEPILRKKYLTRMAWFSTAKNVGSDDTQMWVYYSCIDDANPDDPESYDAVMLLVKYDAENIIQKVTVVKDGTEAMEFKPSDYGIRPYEISGVDATGFILDEVENGNFNSYLIDYSGTSCTVAKDNVGTGETIYVENGWSSEWDMANQAGFDYIMNAPW